MRFRTLIVVQFLIVNVAFFVCHSGVALCQPDTSIQKRPPKPFDGPRDEAMRRFLDDSLTVRERYSAGLRMAEPSDAESEKLLAYAKDKNNDSQLRMLAFAVHANFDRVADSMLAIVRDPGENDPAFVDALVEYVSRWFFVDPTSKLAREGTAALRTRLTDKNEKVRTRAFEGLLSRNDTQAVELITNQLKEKETNYIPEHLAVKYLRRADPRANLGVVSDRFRTELEQKEDQQDQKLLVELVKTMAIDPDYQKSVANLVQKKNLKPDVQKACLASLSYYHADEYPEIALEFLNKPDVGIEVQMEAAKGMVRFLKRGKDSNEFAETALKFGEALKTLKESNLAVPEPDKKLLNNYQKSLYKKFPSVQKKLK